MYYDERLEKTMRDDVRDTNRRIIRDSTGIDMSKGPFEEVEVTVGGLKSAFELTYFLGAGAGRDLDKDRGLKLSGLLVYRFDIVLAVDGDEDIRVTTFWDIITALEAVYREGLKMYAVFTKKGTVA